MTHSTYPEELQNGQPIIRGATPESALYIGATYASAPRAKRAMGNYVTYATRSFGYLIPSANIDTRIYPTDTE
jgi:hypothetical protein